MYQRAKVIMCVVRVNVRHAEFHNILTSPSIPILLRVQSSQLLELNTLDYLRLD